MDLGRAAGKGGEKLLFSLQVLLALAALCSALSPGHPSGTRPGA